MICPVSSTRTGLTKPKRSIEAAIFLICRRECVRAFRGCGRSPSTGTDVVPAGQSGCSCASQFSGPDLFIQVTLIRVVILRAATRSIIVFS